MTSTAKTLLEACGIEWGAHVRKDGQRFWDDAAEDLMRTAEDVTATP